MSIMISGNCCDQIKVHYSDNLPGKSILKLVKLQSLVRNVVKCGKYSLAKFANFVYFCIA